MKTLEETPDTKPSPACWVIKVGGSLLDLPDLAERLRTVVGQVSIKPLIIVGGGPTADLVRGWDKTHHLPTSASHWFAVRAMEFNLHLVETLLPNSFPIYFPKHADQVWEHNKIPLLHPLEWLKLEVDKPGSLPYSWDVTSDSIAAWVTIRCQAEGLVLLKSLDAPGSYESFCDSVDGYFPRLLPELPALSWCNLRSASMKVVSLQYSSP